FLFPAEDRIRGFHVTGVQTCALPIFMRLIEDIIFEIDGNQVFKNVWISDESLLFMPKEHFLGKTIADAFGIELAPLFTKPVARRSAERRVGEGGGSRCAARAEWRL